jgi:2-oxoacid:acceptor oxidoreductase delta subunit (pyruvate/2-ketoisovalerate family)
MGYTFSEIMEGLGDAAVATESARCMHCGSCFNCGNCYNFCPDALVHFDNKDRLRINYEYCKGCGICFNECPSSAMKFDIIKKAKQ